MHHNRKIMPASCPLVTHFCRFPLAKAAAASDDASLQVCKRHPLPPRIGRLSLRTTQWELMP